MSDLPTPDEAAAQARKNTALDWLREYPRWSLRQFAGAWGVAPSTVLRLFRRIGVEKDSTWGEPRDQPDE